MTSVFISFIPFVYLLRGRLPHLPPWFTSILLGSVLDGKFHHELMLQVTYPSVTEELKPLTLKN